MENTLLNATEVAKQLGVARSTIHRRVARGDLVPVAYVGRQPLFTREDVEQLQRGERHLPVTAGAK